MALWGLFLAAFVAATLLPAQSELALAGLLAAGHKPVWLLVAAATAGNILGSAVNWLLIPMSLRSPRRLQPLSSASS